jgi:hypothetical protein
VLGRRRTADAAHRWPVCLLEDHEAVKPTCRRYRRNMDGTETEYRLKDRLSRAVPAAEAAIAQPIGGVTAAPAGSDAVVLLR